MPDSVKHPSTRTVDRALAVLTEVAMNGGMTLNALAKVTDLSASTVLRLVRTLEASGFVSRDDNGEYHSGSRLTQIAAISMGREPLYRLAEVHLAQLRDTTEETAYLGVAGVNDSVLYALVAESRQRLRHTVWLGRSIPQEGTAIGVALQGTPGGSKYVATRRTMMDDVTAVAATVYLPDGRIAGAISVVAPTFRVDDERLDQIGRAVLQHANALSEELGADLSDTSMYTPIPVTPSRMAEVEIRDV